MIIKNGIDVEKYAFDETVREKMRKELGIAPNDYVIGHIGRFVEVKNHKFLIDVFKKLQESVSESKLLLVGIGELMDNIKNWYTIQDWIIGSFSLDNAMM